MRKSRTPGSVRGVSGNGYPYRDSFNEGEDQDRLGLSIFMTAAGLIISYSETTIPCTHQ